MKFRSLMTAICVLAAAQIVSAAQTAPYAYIANSRLDSGPRKVSVIDTATNAVTATVSLPDDNADPTKHPNAYCITVGPSGQYVYVGLKDTNEINIIDTATNTVVMNKRISLGTDIPGGLAVNAAETRLYVTSNMSNTLIVIDISGPGAREVGRVTVDDSSLSNPEGVVLNSTGTKAYVANSTKDSIAEITLDEVNNSYVRSSIISSGTDSYPMGLTISSDDSKLYFASMYGNTEVVALTASPKTVTTLPTNTGNLSVAVNPVSGNVYAPSSVMDTLYAFNSAGTLLGSYNTATTGPWGSSVTPNGAKLFVAMNLDNTVKVYTTANLATPPASIDLTPTAGAGGKPTSLGNFIGPAWPYAYTIAASATPPCTITPSGTVPVTTHGWNFGISGSGCNVTVNGAPVGAATSYKMSNVVDNSQTISVSQSAGTYYRLTVDSLITVVNGFLVSTPSGIGQNSPSAQFLAGSSPSVNAGPGFKAINWTGACAGTADGQPCSVPFVNLSADKNFGATVVLNTGGPIFDVTSSSYYSTWAACTAGAANYDVIKLSTDITAVTTDGPAYQYTMSNQWNKNDYSQKVVPPVPMTLTITSVAVIASDLTL